MYWDYFKYILEHKKNVFIECWEIKEYMHAFTHDLSKFRPSEFIPYARYFYNIDGYGSKFDKYKKHTEEEYEYQEKLEQNFKNSLELHYKRNPHHPEHFKGEYMGVRNIEHMICDLKGMSRNFGGTAQEYYLKNYYKWDLNNQTRLILELHLDLNDSPIHNYGHTLEQFANEYDEVTYNDYFGYIKDVYKVDTYKLFKRK